MPSESVPVVFLPGVMGSKLHFPNSDKDWDPDSTLKMAAWVPIPFFRPADKLRLQLSVDEPAVVPDDPLGNGWDGVAQSFYKPFLEALRDGPPPRTVFAVGYDWRQDMWVTAEFVRDRVQDLLARTVAPQVDVVTHSMGGLVLRAALARAPELKDQVRRVVHVCQPVYGAVVLYRRFFTGLIPEVDGGLSPADIAFRLILGGDAVEFAGNLSGLPGPMQLLPSARYPTGGPDGPWLPFPLSAGAVYDLYADPPRPPCLTPANVADDVREGLATRLNEVRALHARLVTNDAQGNPTDLMFPETWSVFGTGVDTDVGVAFNDGVASRRHAAEGDGTVPAESGAGLFGGRGVPFHPLVDITAERQFVVSNLEHADAMSDPTVLACVQAILK
jgi:pimeloyl-ACP methyl ester carboxylesterase